MHQLSIITALTLTLALENIGPNHYDKIYGIITPRLWISSTYCMTVDSTRIESTASVHTQPSKVDLSGSKWVSLTVAEKKITKGTF